MRVANHAVGIGISKTFDFKIESFRPSHFFHHCAFCELCPPHFSLLSNNTPSSSRVSSLHEQQTRPSRSHIFQHACLSRCYLEALCIHKIKVGLFYCCGSPLLSGTGASSLIAAPSSKEPPRMARIPCNLEMTPSLLKMGSGITG